MFKLTHNWYLSCYHCKETCSHLSSIHTNTFRTAFGYDPRGINSMNVQLPTFSNEVFGSDLPEEFFFAFLVSVSIYVLIFPPYKLIYIYIYIDKNVFKTTRSFCYQWFHVSTLQANATKHGKKTTLNLWIVVNRIKCKRFLNCKPITRRRYIHTFIYERLFLACQTFQISNFTSEYTPLTSQNAHTSSFKVTYHDGDTIYY